MSADVKRRVTHIFKDSGVSQSACHSGHTSQLTARGTAPPRMSMDGSSIEQRGYEKVHWRSRDSVGETKRIGSTLVESNVSCPVASKFSSEVNGTSVVFTCSGDHNLNRWPMQLPRDSGNSQLNGQKRNGTHWMQEGRDTPSTRRLALVRSVKEKVQPTSSTDVAEQFVDPTEVGKTSRRSVPVGQGQLFRAAETDQCIESESKANS